MRVPTLAAMTTGPMRLAPFDLTSLRTRLVLIPTAILFIGMAATIGFILAGQGRVCRRRSIPGCGSAAS